MNIYGFPHKGLRIALSKLSMISGNTDYSNEESLEELKNLTKEIITLLDLHLHSEEDVVLPALEERVPGSSNENIEEHEQLEKAVHDFDEQLKGISVTSSPDEGAKFYEAISNFHSKYLSHMAMEEEEMNPIIWQNFTDEELMGWHGKIMSKLTPDQIIMWFKYIVPALNPFERTVIMGGFKMNAPEDFFNAVLDMLKEHIPENDHSQLQEMLS